MARVRRAKAETTIAIGPQSRYADLSARPLTILLFLTPLLIAYEIGSAVFLDAGSGTIETIRARRLLSNFFELFGVSGLHLPAAALVVTMLVWHLLRRDPWKVKPRVLAMMLAESAAWSAPLLVLGLMVGGAVRSGGAAAVSGASAAGLASASLPARATIAVGAGLYEELLFRMLAIGAAHLALVDIVGLKDRTGKVIGVVVSAAAFALYHDVWRAAGGVDLPTLSFLFIAGLYFGGVYVTRGFGVVVATHTMYDLVVLLLG